MGVFSYFDEDTNATVYHVIPSPQSEYAPSSFPSEADSWTSGTTILSDELPGYFVVHHGRQQAASKNVVKWIPPDNIRRHVLRYIVLKSVFHGHYKGPVKDFLAPTEGRKPQVLELGTKVGTWIQAMANEFPHVQFRSLDVVPIIPHVPRHNIVFEVYDFTEGLLLQDESQDIVFLNSIVDTVKDYRKLLREVYRVLRPGGMIQVCDYSIGIWDPNNPANPSHRTDTRLFRYYDTIRQYIATFGVDPDTCDKLPQWLAPTSELWCKGQKAFRDIQSHVYIQPLYPHDDYTCMDMVDPAVVPYLRHLVTLSMAEIYGFMKDSGLSDEEAKQLIDGAIEDAKHHENCVMTKMYIIYAVKG